MGGIQTSHSFSLRNGVAPPLGNFSQQPCDVNQNKEKKKWGIILDFPCKENKQCMVMKSGLSKLGNWRK